MVPWLGCEQGGLDKPKWPTCHSGFCLFAKTSSRQARNNSLIHRPTHPLDGVPLPSNLPSSITTLQTPNYHLRYASASEYSFRCTPTVCSDIYRLWDGAQIDFIHRRNLRGVFAKTLHRHGRRYSRSTKACP